ncbi:hypothetical protein J4218_06125 [Candidatus Pacearchaeota archaeon]|nr:hypothetical protein [Candidatus Pacearchaeota archaeon]
MTNKLLLNPEEIIVPAELDIGNNKKLREYFDLFNRGIYEHVPPVLVVDKRSKTKQKLIDRINRRKHELIENHSRNPSLHPYPDNFDYHLPYLESNCSFRYEGVIQRLNEDFIKLEKKVGNAKFYLLDGNHRAIAATLNHEPIFALELEDTQDLRKVKKMAEEGIYPELYRSEDTLDELRAAFEYHCLRNFDQIFSVKQRVGELVVTSGLPEFMIRRYLWELGVAV